MSEQHKEKKRGPARPGGGKRKNRDIRKQQRRDDAEIRQAIRDGRTDEQQIAVLDEGRFAATKERKRLAKP